MLNLFNSNKICTQPKSFVEDLNKFLSCLATNYRRHKFFYKNFIFGDNGRPSYMNKYYPKILVNNVIHCREDVLFIVTEDSDFSKFKDLQKIWTEITLKTIKNKNSFGILPQFQKSSKNCFKVTNRSNNVINLHYCVVPRSLEYQVAKIHMVGHNLCISNSIQNDFHAFLNEVANLLDLNIKELIEKSVEMLQSEVWLKSIINLIEGFDCN